MINLFNLPNKTVLKRKIPKNKFYEKIGTDTKLERKFIDEIDYIVWKYKLAKDTVNLEPTKEVEEIQIFEIYLKGKTISTEVLENIDRVIPYPIFYILKYDDDIKLAIAYKERNKADENRMVIHSYYQSEWINEKELDINILSGLTLKDVYENIIRQLIPIESETTDNIEDIIEINKAQEELKKEIEKLERKIKSEKQFNKKVEYNIKLQKKKKEMNNLMNN